MESNDLISREAAIVAVEKILEEYERDPLGCFLTKGSGLPAAKNAIAALPADRRWEELRAWIVARQAKAESYRQWDDLWSMFDLVLDQMDRLAPPAAGETDA